MIRIILYFISFIIISENFCIAETYITWENMEIDKCASAWVIKKFIDKEAEFEFVPKSELITEGIPFDVPEADIRRYHNISAFEYLLKKYKLDDPALKRMGEIIHDIEINYWGQKQIETSWKINERFSKIIETSKKPEDVLVQSFEFFEKMYISLEKDHSGLLSP